MRDLHFFNRETHYSSETLVGRFWGRNPSSQKTKKGRITWIGGAHQFIQGIHRCIEIPWNNHQNALPKNVNECIFSNFPIFLAFISTFLSHYSIRDLIKPYAKRLPNPCPKDEMKKLSTLGKNKIMEYMRAYDEAKEIRNNMKRKSSHKSKKNPKRRKGSSVINSSTTTTNSSSSSSPNYSSSSSSSS